MILACQKSLDDQISKEVDLGKTPLFFFFFKIPTFSCGASLTIRYLKLISASTLLYYISQVIWVSKYSTGWWVGCTKISKSFQNSIFTWLVKVNFKVDLLCYNFYYCSDLLDFFYLNVECIIYIFNYWKGQNDLILTEVISVDFYKAKVVFTRRTGGRQSIPVTVES